jgi:WD40 repeat protein
LLGHEGQVLGCTISGDGRAGLSASNDRTLILWDLTTGEAVSRLALDSIAVGVALSPNRVALIGDHKGNVTCLELVIP